jgi:hypothetical protein
MREFLTASTQSTDRAKEHEIGRGHDYCRRRLVVALGDEGSDSDRTNED